ncbi:nitrilase-related carbon-nitrogen hydrolase [Apibacter adventoris]|uniref:nitrilase-related carbon-nitrogen hydrolase n=1 Tax=Apibacter adventoris TaxID=1679466 RepID=UPI000CF68F1D|nr:nitrilase-related carbon-nitrogen hydrolase [Apibacter adventoris]PQL94560.1 nitrilase family protein [Apibacter adventoris]
MQLHENLIIQYVEFNPKWENIDNNLQYLTSILQGNKAIDLIIFPEMFNSGFSMNTTKIAETMEGTTINWMKKLSLEKNSGICGSLAINENNKYYNRFIFINQGKIIAQYDKHHLFNYSGEYMVYTPGNEKVIFEYKGWKICPMICFDLRFPVWNRNMEDYDLMINVASWPDTRLDAWKSLLKARAIENISYVCGINRIGIDGNHLYYSGHSTILSPLGKKVKTKKIHKSLYQCTLFKTEIHKWRKKYKFLEQRDPFQWI